MKPKLQDERSQNTVRLVSTQAVYKAPHSTVWERLEIEIRAEAEVSRSVDQQ